MRFAFATALIVTLAAAEQFLSEEDFAMEARELEDQELVSDGHGRQLWHQERKTFQNGKNRRYGLNSSRYYNLKTAIQITHAGERNPTTSALSGISDPALTSDGTLTEAGSNTMYSFGQEWADIWADNDDWVSFDGTTPDSAEVYSYSNLNTAEVSSIATNVLGAWGQPNEFPAPTIPTTIVPDIVSGNDLLLDARNQCARAVEIFTDIAEDSDTVKVFDQITEFADDGDYIDKLKELLGDDSATDETLYQAAAEIEAARRSGYDISAADLSTTELKYNDVMANRRNYLDLAGAKDSSYVLTWELLQLMIEVSRITRGDLDLDEAEVINKYWTQAATDGAAAPKLYMLSADRDVIQGLLGVFNNLYLEPPKDGSSFWIDIYECQWNCYWYDEYKVEVIYCPDGNDLKDSCTILNYDRWVQDYRGSARLYDFEKHLKKGLKYQDYFYGYPSQSATDVCSTSYSQKRSYNDPNRFYKDLLKTYGFSYNYHYYNHSHFFDNDDFFNPFFHW